jgi:hypothetical protein
MITQKDDKWYFGRAKTASAFVDEIEKLSKFFPFNSGDDREPKDVTSIGIPDEDTSSPPHQSYGSKVRNLPTYALKKRLNKLNSKMSYMSGNRNQFTDYDVSTVHGKITPIEDELRYRGG